MLLATNGNCACIVSSIQYANYYQHITTQNDDDGTNGEDDDGVVERRNKRTLSISFTSAKIMSYFKCLLLMFRFKIYGNTATKIDYI